MSVYTCCNDNRVTAVTAHPNVNGIKFMEVMDTDAQPANLRQRILVLTFVKDITTPLTVDNIVIEGGERIRNIQVESVQLGAGANADQLTVQVDKAGDFSIYTLKVVDSVGNVLTEYDPLLSEIKFTFKVNCPTDFDCDPNTSVIPPALDEPDLNYLAKDYASFRQLMLDRLAVLLPDWKERNPADVQIMMVEMLAHVGDQLSYFQDAVGTEAYLATARSRVSVRRHARLVDYFMHDGSNARCWVQLQTGTDGEVIPEKSQLLTAIPGLTQSITTTSTEYEEALRQNPTIFETMHSVTLFSNHNEMFFYTWGDEECCLPKGATSATLEGHFDNLGAGDVLILEEVRGAETGDEADAIPEHRHAVRLTRVALIQDPIGGMFDPQNPNPNPVDVTDIEWEEADALPFALCVSSKASENISVARGNIVLADHGMTIPLPDDLGDVPLPTILKPIPPGSNRCIDEDPDHVPARFRPALDERPLTHSAGLGQSFFTISLVGPEILALNQGNLPNRLSTAFSNRHVFMDTVSVVLKVQNERWLISNGEEAFIVATTGGNAFTVYSDLPTASEATQQKLAEVLPAIQVDEVERDIQANTETTLTTWVPQRDLLNSGSSRPDFVVEIENDLTAYLRFGDGTFGQRPSPSTDPNRPKSFRAIYRIGNGRAGNVGAGALIHIATHTNNPLAVTEVRNPLPASGGRDPESIQLARQNAPVAFRTQERAVTEEDYAEITARHPDVQRAVATFRWTGSWYTVFITVDPLGGVDFEDDEAKREFEEEIRDFIEPYRMAGHDVEIDQPLYVSLEIDMTVCIKPEYFRTEVRDALLQVFSCELLPDGSKGAFHPDNFSFGDTVYLSPLFSKAMAVEGVDSVRITKFQRQDLDSTDGTDDGKLELGRTEVARLDNDPNFPNHGVFRLTVEGGK